jgi:acyl transferase domain-containing protein/acyl carrier protein
MAGAASTSKVSAIKLALAAQRLRADSGQMELLQSEPIAVIGLGCRLPGGADGPDNYWRILESGTDAVREISEDRWDIDRFYDPNPRAPAKMATRWAGLLDRIDLFDAEFFGIAPREAASLDPQQRLLLEVSWEALNDAGHPPEKLGGSSTGVFFATYNSDYSRLLFQNLPQIDAHASSGTSHGVAAGRLSYLLNILGPSMVVDTACSSSLVAVHLACQSLRSGECSLAITGGANLIISPEETIALSKWGMLAPDGRCKTFDAAANGFVRGEGCGVIILKRLADALADGDRIHGLIRGTAVNQDGRSTVLTAPNGLAQQAVVRQALRNARVAPAQVSYVEAHGTGTALGDPIEVEALAAVLGAERSDGSRCRLGSVKTNLGHLEAAAGIAGLIKVLLAMRHRTIPPHLHFKTLNPLISLDGTCLEIGGTAAPWPPSETSPRFAGVSSFGFGGTNAHVVLEEPPRLPSVAAPSMQQRQWLFPLSARTAAALRSGVKNVLRHLLDAPCTADIQLADLCHTAAVCRWHYPVRAAFTAATVEELTQRLQAHCDAQPHASLSDNPAKPGKLAFVFSGQGSQWLGMGRVLLQREPVFRNQLDLCDAALTPLSGWSVVEALTASATDSRLDQTEVFQPVLFALQTALAALWKSWGIEPDAIIGHSVGEIAAGFQAGAISLEEGAAIAVLRGRLMQTMAPLGAMAAVELAAEESIALSAQLGLELTVAAINAPRMITLAGRVEIIDAFVTALTRRGIPARRLSVNRAFHSADMSPCAAELQRQLGARIRGGPCALPFFSTVDAEMRTGRVLDPDYWARNVRAPVQFAAAMQAALRAGCSRFVEIGPHPVLATALSQILAASGTAAVAVSSLRRDQDEQAAMLAGLSRLFAAGCDIHWEQVNRVRGHVISLPPYPWQRERHWLESAPAAAASSWPGRPQRSALFAGTLLEYELAEPLPAFVAQHRVCGVATVPATAILDLALAAARQEFDGELDGSLVVEDLAIERVLAMPVGIRRTLQAGCTSDEPRGGAFRLYSRPVEQASQGDDWVLHATARWRVLSSDQEAAGAQTATLLQAQQACPIAVDVPAHYAALHTSGIEFGPRFRRMEHLWRGEAAGLARIRALDESRPESHAANPELLDACMQAVTAAYPGSTGAASTAAELYLPVSIQSVCLFKPLSQAAWSFAQLRARDARPGSTLVADISIFTGSGEPMGSVRGLRLHPTERAQLERMLCQDDGMLYELDWQPQALPRPRTPPGRCLILSDHTGVAQAIEAGLIAAGTECITVAHAEEFQWLGGQRYALRSDASGDFRSLLRELRVRGQWPLAHVVHCCGLDVLDLTAGKPPSPQRLACGSALLLLQALAAEAADIAPRVWFLSRNGTASRGAPAPIEPSQAPIQGLARVASLEYPQLRCTTLDLQFDGTASEPLVEAIVAELHGNDGGENQIALAPGKRSVPRLRHVKPVTRPVNIALRPPAAGLLEDLSWVACPRVQPAAGEVEIEVGYAGLNFRDVLSALQVVSAVRESLGAECAGRVVTVGAHVKNLRVGDEVTAFALGGLKRFVNVSASLTTHKPPSATLEQAAALPVIFLTALYALHRLVTLRAGQSVLIHAAAGGVGYAAVQLARLAGATIFATVGTAEKAALVKCWGADHVLSSRSLKFAEEIRAISAGTGVDVVLNSLSGEFASASLDLVRSGGVFIELGKRDLLDPETVAGTHPGVRYAAFDMAEIAMRDPALIQSLLAEMQSLLSLRRVLPPPTTLFPAASVVSAFRCMAQARHVGKIVIAMERAPAACSPDGVYLITGGLGALGLQFARWLASRGAARIALLGRGAPGAVADAALQELRGAGVTVKSWSVDIADRSELQQVLHGIRHELGPVRGVLHAAGVLDDATIGHLEWSRFERVMRPKMDGGWNLHDLTRDDPLECFVLFSSMASTLGWSGQAGYAAANAFLDGLAHYRRALGMPAVSINWGPWGGGSGMAANLGARDVERMTERGIRALSIRDGLAVYEQALEQDRPQMLAVAADWSRFVAQFPAAQAPPLLRALRRQAGGDASRVSPHTADDSAAAQDFSAALAALPLAQRWTRLLEFVERQAAHVLGLAPGKVVDAKRPLRELGLDSLMSVELRNALAASLNIPLNATVLFDYPTVELLARYLAKDLLECEIETGERADDTPASAAVAAVRRLSDEEAEASLLRELEQTSP